jgi:hypothetical protein
VTAFRHLEADLPRFGGSLCLLDVIIGKVWSVATPHM